MVVLKEKVNGTELGFGAWKSWEPPKREREREIEEPLKAGDSF